MPYARYLLFAGAAYFVFAYPLFRLTHWSSDAGLPFIASVLIALGGLAGMYYSFRAAHMKIRYAMVHWLGISFVFATCTLIADGARFLLPLTERSLAMGVIGLASGLVLFALGRAQHLAVRHRRIPSDKVTRRYRIVQISDVHIGSRQAGFMRRIVRAINRLHPDYVVITGDLLDSSAVEYEALASLTQLTARTFFSIGNHERYAGLPKVLALATRLRLETLSQRAVVYDELRFIGIDDAESRTRVARGLAQLPKTINYRDKFNILLYHRPVGWAAARAYGIDLMLSGHTHNGQIFPFKLLVKHQFKYICGLYRRGQQYLYVNAGTGTWGPLMRLGSCNEITVFEIVPHRKVLATAVS